MKKYLYIALLAVLSCNVFAQDSQKAPTNGFTIQFCKEIGSWYTLLEQNKVNYKCYIYISPEMATMVAGNQITHITFSAASSFDSTSTPREGSVFVTEDINGENTTATACTVENCLQKSKPYQTVSLNEPYTIKENTGFYFGYVVKNCRFSKATGKADFPVGVDLYAPSGYSGYVELTDAVNDTLIATVDMAADMGANATNLFLAATTVGEKKGFFDTFTLGSPYLDDFTLPVISTESNKPLSLPVKNVGGNKLTSLVYNYEINGIKEENITLAIDIDPGKESNIVLDVPQYLAGYNNITVNVSKVNGVSTDVSSNIPCIALDNEGYDRKFVVEEGTGTWCGWCPRGIVGLENMSQKYPDSFIGIAVHSQDDFYTKSYASVISGFFGAGLPNSVINRDPVYVLDPSFDMLNLCYDYWKGQRAPAKIDLAVDATEPNELKVTTTTTFAYNEDKANYRLAFAILEEGLTGKQTNYYSGNTGALEEWDAMPDPADWTYEHTARDIFYANGSIPSTIVAGQPMTFSGTLSLENIADKANTSVVAMLIDTKTGVILNATKVEAKDYTDPSAIDNAVLTEADAREQQEFYNLQGVRLAKPSGSGIVITRKNGKVRKVLLR